MAKNGRYFFTSESVTEGHPDKISDQISDAILDEVMREDPMGRVACETLVTTGLAFIAGEITTSTYVDFTRVVRETIKDIGYTRAKFGFDYETCAVINAVQEQSPDIAQGVDIGGAGDQGLMFGYACRETPEFMPLPITLAHKLCMRLAQVRKERLLEYIRPDGKSQVTIEYHNGEPVRVDTVVIAIQHSSTVETAELREDVTDMVINHVIPPELRDERTRYYINQTGRFVVGGPHGDTGVTGRKIIVDTYGGVGSHGGGAFSGKDPTKVDRSASYMARYVAKNLVAAGVADKLELQLAYAIGHPDPVSIMVDTLGTGRVDEDKIKEIIRGHFPMTPKGIIDHLQLRRPIFRKTAAYGHFGRNEPEFTWERTDKADAIARDAGLPVPAAVAVGKE